MTRNLRIAAVLTALTMIPCAAFAAGGSSVPTSPSQQKTPAEQADELYNRGLTARDAAWKLETKLSETEALDKQEKLEKKIRSNYERALADFTQAVQVHPDHYRAYGSMGYVYRRLGDLDSAMEAYNHALKLDPGYAEAIEYRAEAYLALNDVESAKQAYDQLAQKNEKLAGELLFAMDGWLEARRSDPAGVKVATLDEFERWIDDRESGKPQVSKLRKTRSW